MSRSLTGSLSLALAATLAVAMAAPALAQEEEVAKSTISAIDRGEAQAMVYLEGAALAQLDDDEFLFSDGTGTITIDVDESAEAGLPPLFELIGVAGTVASDEIDVSRWALLPIMTPAVIVEEPQVIDAFWGWIIAYGSQAPAE
jgi:uncharacterized protein YdeI (BOF family)